MNNQPHLVKFQDKDDSEGISQYFVAVEQKLMLECCTLSAALFFGMFAHFNLKYRIRSLVVFSRKCVPIPIQEKGGKHLPSCIAHITGISRFYAKLCKPSALECDEHFEDSELP